MGGFGTELNLLNTQVRKNSLNIAQIVQSSPDPCHMITSVRSQPLSSFILQLEGGYKLRMAEGSAGTLIWYRCWYSRQFVNIISNF